MRLCTPQIRGPLCEWMTRLTVEGCVPGATVVIRAIGPNPRDIAKGVATGAGRERLALSPGVMLLPGDLLIAWQELGGIESLWTADALAEPVSKAPTDHSKLAAPTFKSRLFECGKRVVIGGTVPGAWVTVAGPGGTIAEGRADEDAAWLNLTGSYPPPGGVITVHLGAPPGRVPLAGTPKVTAGTVRALAVLPQGTLPAPQAKGAPPEGCDSSLELTGVIDGATVTVSQQSSGASQSATFGLERIVFRLSTPIPPAGDRLVVSQAMPWCERQGEPLEVRCPPATAPAPPGVESPCPGTPLIALDGLEPGCQISVQVNGETYLGIIPHDTPSWQVEVAPVPPDAVIRVVQERCGLASTPVTEVRARQLLVTGPPSLAEPLFGCARVVRVVGATAGAWVRVWASGPNWKGPISRVVRARSDTFQVQVSPYLQLDHQVWVEELACGGPWLASDRKNVVDPPVVLPPSIAAPPVAGSWQVQVDAIPGAYVEVFDAEGRHLGSGVVDPNDRTVWLDSPVPADGYVTARQTMCHLTSERGPSAPIVPPERTFSLVSPIVWPASTAVGEEVMCDSAHVVCRHDGTWELTAHFENKAKEADVQLIFGFALVPKGTPPFGVTHDVDLSAAGDGRVTRIGFRVLGIPPARTVNRRGVFPAFRDPYYWASVVLPAHEQFTMLAAWQRYPEPSPDDPDEGD